MDTAARKLVEDNIDLAHKFIQTHYVNAGFEPDDKRAIAYLGLCKAADMFDESKGLKFSTLAYVVMNNEFRMILRKKRITPTYLEDLLTDAENLSGIDIIDAGISIEHSVGDRICCIEAIAKLPSIDKKVLNLLLKNPGLTQRQCANELGISQASVSRAVKRFKQQYLELA